MKIVSGFTFNDFCQHCQTVTRHNVAADNSSLFGLCSSCELQRPLTELKEIYYKKTDLWVTRFNISNLWNVVTGRLLDAIRVSRK